jgi:hypothetical protein
MVTDACHPCYTGKTNGICSPGWPSYRLRPYLRNNQHIPKEAMGEKILNTKRADGVAQVPCKPNALSSTPSTTNT